MADPLGNPRFPRSSRYHPDWILAGVSGGANPLWLAEWLSEAVELRPGQRVLDLGCGRALSSVFLHRELGVQVWAADLWCNPDENRRRIEDAGCAGGVFPLHLNARSLPFAAEFFDAVVCHDSFMYFGADPLFLPSLARFVKPGGWIGAAMAGLTREVEEVPEHLRDWWTPDVWTLHAADWWGRLWGRSGVVELECADFLPEGWTLWRDWIRLVAPENTVEISALEADAGATLGYVRLVARRTAEGIDPPITSLQLEYTPAPLLRDAV